MARHRLVLAPPCLRAESMYWIDAVFCHAAVVATPRSWAASDLATGTTVGFDANGTGRLYEIEGWNAAGPDGTATDAARASLAFRDVEQGPLVAAMVLSAGPDRASATVTIDAGGQASRPARLDGHGRDTKVVACIGPLREAGDVIRVDLSPGPSEGAAASGPTIVRLRSLEVLKASGGLCLSRGRT